MYNDEFCVCSKAVQWVGFNGRNIGTQKVFFARQHGLRARCCGKGESLQVYQRGRGLDGTLLWQGKHLRSMALRAPCCGKAEMKDTNMAIKARCCGKVD